MKKILFLFLFFVSCTNEPYVLPTITIHHTDAVVVDKITYGPKGLDNYYFKMYVQSNANYKVFVNLIARDYSGHDVTYFETGTVDKGRTIYNVNALVGPNHEIDYFILTIGEIIESPHEI